MLKQQTIDLKDKEWCDLDISQIPANIIGHLQHVLETNKPSFITILPDGGTMIQYSRNKTIAQTLYDYTQPKKAMLMYPCGKTLQNQSFYHHHKQCVICESKLSSYSSTQAQEQNIRLSHK